MITLISWAMNQEVTLVMRKGLLASSLSHVIGRSPYAFSVF
jgi:hypothetical protein